MALSRVVALTLVAAVASPAAAQTCIDYGTFLRREGVADTPGAARGIVIAGGLAYVADADSGLAIVDLYVLGAPELRSCIDTPSVAEAADVRGGFAYVADGAAGLRIVDVSDPDAPVPRAPSLSVFPNPFRTATSIRVAAGIARSRLVIVDVAGRIVRRLDAPASGTEPVWTWNGADERGRPVAAGMYFVQDEVRTRPARAVVRLR
jgi:hypothetical protein